MNDNFLKDLDDYFSVYYNNYNMISSLKGYTEDKRDFLLNVYTNTDTKYNYKPNENKYRLCFQKNKVELLTELKKIFKDNHFEFSFKELPLKFRIKAFFNKQLQFGFFIKKILIKYGFSDYNNFYELISFKKNIWINILKSRILPSKRLLFKICLFLGTNIEDNLLLLKKASFDYNYRETFDVIVRYLIEKKIFNQSLIALAFNEYNLKPLF